jgi:hypothetical protein
MSSAAHDRVVDSALNLSAGCFSISIGSAQHRKAMSFQELGQAYWPQSMLARLGTALALFATLPGCTSN